MFALIVNNEQFSRDYTEGLKCTENFLVCLIDNSACMHVSSVKLPAFLHRTAS